MNMANGWPDRYGWVGRWRGVRTVRYTYTRWYQNERGPRGFLDLGQTWANAEKWQGWGTS